MKLTKHWAARLDDYVIDLAWSPDGAHLAAASSAGPVSIFAADDGAKLHVLPGHDGGTNVIGFPSVGLAAPLATGGQDGNVKLWDVAAGQHTATAPFGGAWIEHLAWRPGEPALLAAAAGRKVSFLNPDGTLAHALPDSPKTVSALAWMPAGPDPGEPSGVIAVACFGHVRLVDSSNFSVQRDYPYSNGIHALVWSPDGRWLVSGNQDPSVHLWIPEEDIELQMSGYESKVKRLSFDPTSRWLATAGGRDACVWDCSGAGPEGRAPAMFPHDHPVSALAFQSSHGLLATASQGGEVQIWSPERQQPLRATVRLPDAVTKMAWTRDDAFLAIGSNKGVVYVLACEA
jgi:WD40 repeat protein